MGLYKNLARQPRKPEGFLGNIMIKGMNAGHAKMVDWGMNRLKNLAFAEIVDIGCGGGRNAGELLQRYPNESDRYRLLAAVCSADGSV